MGLRECPCKFRLGLGGNNPAATVTVTSPDGTDVDTFVGTINFSAEQCFTGGPNCNPSVDQFDVTFTTGGANANTINLTGGTREPFGTIFCVDDTQANLIDGTATGTGNTIPMQEYSVDFTYTITGNIASLVVTATGEDNTVVVYTAFAPVSPQTFIGECEDTVGP
nr:hypothetical protein [Neobacillus sp. Marseille-Q6967]